MPSFRPSYTQEVLLKMIQALGYKVDAKGICFGLARMAQFASFVPNGINTFQKRLERLIEIYRSQADLSLLPQNLYLSLNTLKRNVALLKANDSPRAMVKQAEENLEQAYDLIAFFDSVVLLQNPHRYEELSPVHSDLLQTDLPFESLVRPKCLEQSRWVNPVNIIGAYRNEEMAFILGQMEQHFGDRVFSLSIVNSHHALHMSYFPIQRIWYYFDANALPGFFLYDVNEIASYLQYSLEGSSYTLANFNLVCLDTGKSQAPKKILFNAFYQPIEQQCFKRLPFKNLVGASQSHLAAILGNTAFFKKIGDASQCSLNTPDINGDTPLGLASYYGHQETVNQILELAGIKGELETVLLHKNHKDESALFLACKKGQVHVVKSLFDVIKKIRIPFTVLNAMAQNGITPYLLALNHENEALYHLFSSYFDLSGLSQKEVRLMLIKSLAQSLEKGAFDGRLDLVKNCTFILLKLEVSAAELNFTNKEGYSPLYWAFEQGHPKVAAFLLAAVQLTGTKTSELNVADKTGYSLLHLACENRNILLVQLLFSFISQRASTFEMNPADRDGYTPLHAACFAGDKAIVSYLLKAFEKANVPDEIIFRRRQPDNKTAAELALAQGHHDIVQLFKIRRQRSLSSMKPLPSTTGLFKSQTLSIIDKAVKKEKSPSLVQL